jgi:hypothetical protein
MLRADKCTIDSAVTPGFEIKMKAGEIVPPPGAALSFLENKRAPALLFLLQ